MGVIGIRGITTSTSGAASSPTPGGAIPAEAETDDLLIAVIQLTSAAPAFSNIPAGWTQITASPSTSVGSTRAFRYRIQSSDEAGTAWSMTAGSTRWSAITVVVYDDEGLPVTLEQATSYLAGASAGTVSPPSAAITPAAVDTLIVAAVGGSTAATTGGAVPTYSAADGWTLHNQVTSSLTTLRNSTLALLSKPNPGIAAVPQTVQPIVNDVPVVPTCISFALSNTNVAPTADAGTDQTVSPGATVVLDGNGSFDPDGDVEAYAWTQMSGPTVVLSSETDAQPSFVAPETVSGATLVFALTVTDDRSAASEPDTVTVTVGPSASMRVRIDGAWVSHPLRIRQADAWA